MGCAEMIRAASTRRFAAWCASYCALLGHFVTVFRIRRPRRANSVQTGGADTAGKLHMKRCRSKFALTCDPVLWTLEIDL